VEFVYQETQGLLDPSDEIDNMFSPKLAPCGTYYQRAESYEKLGKKDLAAEDKDTAAQLQKDIIRTMTLPF
jgi:hypothetical protein